MRLATRNNGSRDGELVLVAPDGQRCLSACSVIDTLQHALEDWPRISAELQSLYTQVVAGAAHLEPLALNTLLAPLPRAYEWVDGSAYIHHIKLVRQARGAEPPATLESDPLVYQGGSGVLLGPYADLELLEESWGMDLEAEICAVLTDTPIGTRQDSAADHIALLTLANDITYRNLVPEELAKGFGFFQSKPATVFGPFAVTPDELGPHWRDGRLHAEVRSRLNGEVLGRPNAGPEMHFSFFDLVAHLCKTRSYTAGTLLGSGTVSNAEESTGSSCIAEIRMREIIKTGTAYTPYLKIGDTVEIEAKLGEGFPFGSIRNRVIAARRGAQP